MLCPSDNIYIRAVQQTTTKQRRVATREIVVMGLLTITLFDNFVKLSNSSTIVHWYSEGIVVNCLQMETSHRQSVVT